ncbi:MAG TPA: exosortase/archaeosortase family protein [Opitutaceae bacterium]|jgi:exosortase|nr:exosortase/archaeosortase family protein [Opitutaceae bacterium]
MTQPGASGAAARGLAIGLGALAALLLLPLGTAWQVAPDMGHGWAAPLLIGYLYWERLGGRPRFGGAGPLGARRWLAAAAILALALPLQLLLQPFPLWPIVVWLYAGLLAAAAITAAGWSGGRRGAGWVAGPLVVLLAALPWPSALDHAVILPLREAMADVAAEISNFLGHPALAEGTSVRLGTAWVGVDEACGGIRSLQAAVMAALFLGEWRRFAWRRRVALVFVGVGAALLGNFSRILFLSERAAAGSAAALAAHDAAGWLALAITLGLTGLAAWIWARRPAAPASSRAGGSDGMARPGAALWLAIVAGGLWLEQAAVWAWYARGAAATAQAAHWTARLPEDAWNFRREPLGEEAREMLRPDVYAAASWGGAQNQIYSAYYIEWHEGQIARFVPFLHNPTVCLPFSGCELERSLGDIAVRWPGGEIPFHAYLFRQAGQELAVAFAVWDTSRNRPMATDPGGWKGWFEGRWGEVRQARRNQPAQMLSLAIAGPGGQSELEATLQSLIVGP